jgi:hypothetical protein
MRSEQRKMEARCKLNYLIALPEICGHESVNIRELPELWKLCTR